MANHKGLVDCESLAGHAHQDILKPQSCEIKFAWHAAQLDRAFKPAALLLTELLTGPLFNQSAIAFLFLKRLNAQRTAVPIKSMFSQVT